MRMTGQSDPQLGLLRAIPWKKGSHVDEDSSNLGAIFDNVAYRPILGDVFDDDVPPCLIWASRPAPTPDLNLKAPPRWSPWEHSLRVCR